jgi:ORF6N domain-containing protein
MSLLPIEHVERRIYFLREHRVMLDSDLAELYGVTTFNLNKSVRRNLERFPTDFMFQLTEEEFSALIFQIGISKRGRGGRRHLPYVFTQEGVSMLSGVLHSQRAVQVHIAIMRGFSRVKELLATHKELARKLEELEQRYDSKFKVVFDAIRNLMEKPAAKLLRIKGFRPH